MVREMMEFLPSAKVGLKTYLRDDLQISPAFRSKVHGFKSHKMTSSDNQQLQWPDFRIFTILSFKALNTWSTDVWYQSNTSNMSNTREIPELHGVEIEENPWFLTSHPPSTSCPANQGATHRGSPCHPPRSRPGHRPRSQRPRLWSRSPCLGRTWVRSWTPVEQIENHRKSSS